MRKRIIALLLTVIFTLQVPASAGAFSYFFEGYTPPTSGLTSDAGIIQDANTFIEAYYKQANYLPNPKGIMDKDGKTTVIPLRVQKDYNIADDRDDSIGTIAPMLYYEKAGGGPDRNQQYLGQTKDGATITNVRFPLNASWSFLEDLNWVPAGDKMAFNWWKNQGNSITNPTKLYFNQKANSDPNYAQLLDYCIGVATIGQLRNWDGQQYYISKAQMGTDKKPGKPGGAIIFDPAKATNFQWHKYVNVLMPPTFNTYGYGIGFYQRGGSYSYKSFPIMPLKYGLLPDFTITLDPGIEPENQIDDKTWWAEPGKTYTGTATIKIESLGAMPPFTPPAAVKVRNVLVDMIGEAFTEEAGKAFRLKADREGEYKAEFTWTMPTNVRSAKIVGAVNTWKDSVIPNTVGLRTEKDTNNNLTEITVRANIDDLGIRAPQRKYVGPAGSTVDIKPGVTNENRGKLSYNTTLSWRWKDEPNKWTDMQVNIPYTEIAKTYSLTVPIPATERKLIIAVNRHIATDPAQANPPVEYDINNNFDGASAREAIIPAVPPADYIDPSTPTEEILVMPEAQCEDFIITLERGGGATVWSGNRVQLTATVKRGQRTSYYGEVYANVTISGPYIGTKRETVLLKAGESRQFKYVVGPLAAGKQTWTATVDSMYYGDYNYGYGYIYPAYDCNPNNNKDTLVMNAKALPTLPGETDIQVELRG